MKEVEQGTSGKTRGQIFTRENHSCSSRKEKHCPVSDWKPPRFPSQGLAW